MLRSMYAGISGMKGFQTKLDVVGNNIANVNTAGFKKGRVMFQDMLSQPLTGASAPTEDGTRGGVNPRQVGTGSQIGAIDTVDTQGNRQTTDRPLDVQIEGDGYFVVENGDEQFYTRAGNFYLDDDGNLVNPDGYYVLDTDGDRIEIPNEARSLSITADGTINYNDEDGLNTDNQIGLSLFSNPGGLEKVGSNLYSATVNAQQVNEGGEYFTAGGPEGVGNLVAGALEMSNVDLSEEFTEMITAQRGFQANTRIITTSDEILQELVNLKR
ncbi:flagellar basal body rod protein FlgG [Gracilibacillus sp. S3-1-1]|uniref:Flagellar basal body rod protein FlgG n=1 Tax=Gracilibacillus pellucidus TaxID=3095368 RepID=A0ACC6M7R8_9BACI|nr:flagellar basal body rod protein FlgG [Gracilibacillus sp. S3-1-1]MDX8046943.1 flagellar basal body rod protein FlgG [Gracilibacillus sp. S3-1-1]